MSEQVDQEQQAAQARISPASRAEPVGTRWGDEISAERATDLKVLADEQREWAGKPEAERGDSHFKDVQLTGADVFWLAAYALAGVGEEVAAAREKLRAARDDVDLRISLDLFALHLEGAILDEAHLEEAILREAHLEGASLREAHLEGASLREAHLEGASLREAHLDQAVLDGAHLEGADLNAAHLDQAAFDGAHLEGADLREAHLDQSSFDRAHLEGADLREAHLEEASLREARMEGAVLSAAHMKRAILRKAHLEGAILREAHLKGATLFGTHLEGVYLGVAHLEGANLGEAHLEGAILNAAHLERANLGEAHLEGAILNAAHLEGTRLAPSDLTRIKQWNDYFPEVLFPADVSGAFFSTATSLEDTIFGDAKYGRIAMVGARWDEIDLSAVNWGKPKRRKPLMLGDERVAREPKYKVGSGNRKRKDRPTRLREFRDAARANRQLATVLQAQGLSDLADEMAYRAQVLQRTVFRHQRRYGRWLFSWLLAALAGYGYRLERIFITYALTIAAFALVYLAVGVPNGFPAHTSPLADVFQLSFTAIHGRQSVEQLKLGSVLAWVAAIESIVGIVIEGVFTAMLVQRFFGK